MDDGPESSVPFSLLRRPVPPWAVLRVITIEPGADLAFVADDWRDALVVVEQGQIELVCVRGGRRSFGCGAVLWLFGEPLVHLHNGNHTAVVLAAVSRRSIDGPNRHPADGVG